MNVSTQSPCERQDLRKIGLDGYAVRALRRNGIETVDDLLAMSWEQIWALPYVKHMTVRQVSICLNACGKDLKKPYHVLGSCKEDRLACAPFHWFPGLENIDWSAFRDRKQNRKYSDNTYCHVSGLKALTEQELCNLLGYWNLEKVKTSFNRMGLDLNLRQE